MERAVARIDTAAVKRNCAHLAATVGDGVELCAVVKADGYGHGADVCAEAAIAGGARRLAVATGAEAAAIGRRLPHVPLLTMGALTEDELDAALAAGSEVALWHEEFLAAGEGPRQRPGPARPGPRQARQRHGHGSAIATPGPSSPWPAPATTIRTSSWPASGPISRPPTNRSRASSTSSCGASTTVAAAVKAEFPAVTRPRRQQRRRLSRPRLSLRHGPLRRRRLRARSLSRRSRRARPGAGAVAALLRRRRQALRAGRQRRLRADAGRPRGDLDRRACRSATATAFAAASATTPRCWSAAGATRWSGRSRWTTSRSTSAPSTEVEPGDEAVLIGSQGEDAILAEEVAARLGNDQLRGHLRDLGAGAARDRPERESP